MEEIVEIIKALEEIKEKFKKEKIRLNRILANTTGETLQVKRRKDFSNITHHQVVCVNT